MSPRHPAAGGGRQRPSTAPSLILSSVPSHQDVRGMPMPPCHPATRGGDCMSPHYGAMLHDVRGRIVRFQHWIHQMTCDRHSCHRSSTLPCLYCCSSPPCCGRNCSWSPSPPRHPRRDSPPHCRHDDSRTLSPPSCSPRDDGRYDDRRGSPRLMSALSSTPRCTWATKTHV